MLSRLFIIGLIACSPFTFLPAQEIAASAAPLAENALRQDATAWGKDLDAAQRKAQAQKAPLAVLFTAGWSPQSKAFVSDVLPKAEVAKALAGHVCVQVDGDANAAAVKAHKVSAYPTLVLLDAAGQETHRMTQLATTPAGFLAQFKAKAASVTKSAPSKSPAAKKLTSSPAAAAVLKRLASTSYTLSGKARVLETESEDGMVMLMPGMMGSTALPFEGSFHIRRDAAGDVLVASKAALPGMALFARGKTLLTRTTVKPGTEIAMGDLNDDLAVFLAPKSLASWGAAKAKWEVTEKGDGSSTHRTTIPDRFFVTEREVLEADDGTSVMMIDPMAVKVIRGELELNVDAEGGLVALTLTVVRSDPMAAVQELMGNGEDGEMGFDPSELDDMDPIDGVAHRYSLKPTATAKSARLEALGAAFRALLD